jgi:hypothetical protein
MKRMRWFAVLMLLAFWLIGCYPREEVDFSTDPRILRGIWEGRLHAYPEAGQTQTIWLKLEASYLTPTTYRFSGVIRIGGGASQVIEGEAFGGQWEVYMQSTIISPPRPSGFIAMVPTLGLKFCGYGDSDIRSYYGGVLTQERGGECPVRPTYLAEPNYRFAITLTEP